MGLLALGLALVFTVIGGNLGRRMHSGKALAVIGILALLNLLLTIFWATQVERPFTLPVFILTCGPMMFLVGMFFTALVENDTHRQRVRRLDCVQAWEQQLAMDKENDAHPLVLARDYQALGDICLFWAGKTHYQRADEAYAQALALYDTHQGIHPSLCSFYTNYERLLRYLGKTEEANEVSLRRASIDGPCCAMTA